MRCFDRAWRTVKEYVETVEYIPMNPVCGVAWLSVRRNRKGRASVIMHKLVATVNPPVSDRGLFPSTKTHGQEGADRGYPLVHLESQMECRIKQHSNHRSGNETGTD
jgi:hypothetical protein